jgi:hypothetical protein
MGSSLPPQVWAGERHLHMPVHHVPRLGDARMVIRPFESVQLHVGAWLVRCRIRALEHSPQHIMAALCEYPREVRVGCVRNDR